MLPQSKADATVGGANSFPAWDDLLPKCLQTLATAIDVNFARLWPVGVPEEEFVGLFVKSALRVMEQSANTRSGSATRTAVVQVWKQRRLVPALCDVCGAIPDEGVCP